MKVAIDLTALADNFSGIERYAAEIAKALLIINETDNNPNEYILLFKNSISPLFRPFLRSNNVEFKVIFSKGSKLRFTQFELPKELNKVKADAYLFMAFPAPFLFRSKKSISTIHDLTCWDYPETMTAKSRLLWRVLNKEATKGEKQIITLSEFSKGRIVDHYKLNPNRITVAYCGISDSFCPVSLTSDRMRRMREKYELPDSFILAVGTLEPRKNLSLLIRAWAELRREGRLLDDLVLSGRSGWKNEEILSYLNDEELKHIHVTGFVDDDDLPAIYAMSSMFVFPSLYEGFGMPPVEAVNSGASVLCSDIKCLREVCKDSVSYFKSNDLDDLKRAMTQGGKSGDPLLYEWRRSAQKIKDRLL